MTNKYRGSLYEVPQLLNLDNSPKHLTNSPLCITYPFELTHFLYSQTNHFLSNKRLLTKPKPVMKPTNYFTLSASPEHDHHSLSSTSFFHSLLAGAIAGTNEHLLMHPFDTIKTRMQADNGSRHPVYRSTTHAIRTMLAEEGPMSFWRGAVAVSLGAAPSHALYFGAYESCKTFFHNSLESHINVANALAGASATIIQDFTMNPFDVVKQRMQIKQYKSMRECVAQTIKSEGIASLWRSYPTTLAMNVPFYAAYTSSYELGKEILHEKFSVDPQSFSLSIDFLSGGLAGGLAAFLTNPLDVAKTRLQLGSMSITEGGKVTFKQSHIYTGFWSTLSSVFQTEGIAGFWKGVVPRLISNVPSAAICWTTYEGCKFFLTHASDEFQG